MMSDTFNLTNSEIEDLLEISQRCPAEGSFATLIARGLFHTFVADSVFDDRPCYIYEPQELSYKNSEVHILKCEPNPTNEFVNIFTNVGQIITSYNIFNTVGKKVLSQTNLEDSRVNINLSSLNSGIYIINAITSDGQIVSNKLNYIK